MSLPQNPYAHATRIIIFNWIVFIKYISCIMRLWIYYHALDLLPQGTKCGYNLVHNFFLKGKSFKWLIDTMIEINESKHQGFKNNSKKFNFETLGCNQIITSFLFQGFENVTMFFQSIHKVVDGISNVEWTQYVKHVHVIIKQRTCQKKSSFSFEKMFH